MGKILQIDEDNVKALAKKCPQWKDGLKELFPEAFPQRMFECGTIFATHPKEGKDAVLYKLRHAPGNKQYCLADLLTGFNMRDNKSSGRGSGTDTLYFYRKTSKMIEIPIDELGLSVVPMGVWLSSVQTVKKEFRLFKEGFIITKEEDPMRESMEDILEWFENKGFIQDVHSKRYLRHDEASLISRIKEVLGK
jgi:hypothetical protein